MRGTCRIQIASRRRREEAGSRLQVAILLWKGCAAQYVSYWSLETLQLAETYPDSVNRVRPPNTTIPNTLAALARRKYPTDLELVSGKDELFMEEEALA